MIDTLLFIGNEVVSWIMTNAPLNGFIIVVAWLAWTIRGATNKFDKETLQLNNRIGKGRRSGRGG